MTIKFLRKFSRDNSGSVITEGLVVFPIMMLVIVVAVEFVYGMYQWNIASKAMHLAARQIAVSAPFTTDFDTVFDSPPGEGGDLINPTPGITSTCGAGSAPCIEAAMDYLIDRHDPPLGNGWYGLQNYYPQLDPESIRITYQRNGLGFVDRPSGPVTTARLEFSNASFQLPLLGILLNFGNINLPPFTVSITTEDLSNCPFTEIVDRVNSFRCGW